MRIQTQELSQLVIAAVSELERFQSGVESSLLFIEQARQIAKPLAKSKL